MKRFLTMVVALAVVTVLGGEASAGCGRGRVRGFFHPRQAVGHAVAQQCGCGQGQFVPPQYGQQPVQQTQWVVPHGPVQVNPGVFNPTGSVALPQWRYSLGGGCANGQCGK